MLLSICMCAPYGSHLPAEEFQRSWNTSTESAILENPGTPQMAGLWVQGGTNKRVRNRLGLQSVSRDLDRARPTTLTTNINQIDRLQLWLRTSIFPITFRSREDSPGESGTHLRPSCSYSGKLCYVLIMTRWWFDYDLSADMARKLEAWHYDFYNVTNWHENCLPSGCAFAGQSWLRLPS